MRELKAGIPKLKAKVVEKEYKGELEKLEKFEEEQKKELEKFKEALKKEIKAEKEHKEIRLNKQNVLDEIKLKTLEKEIKTRVAETKAQQAKKETKPLEKEEDNKEPINLKNIIKEKGKKIRKERVNRVYKAARELLKGNLYQAAITIVNADERNSLRKEQLDAINALKVQNSSKRKVTTKR